MKRWVEECYNDKIPKRDRIDEVYNTVDNLLLAGSFPKCNLIFSILMQSDVFELTKKDMHVTLSFLTVTNGDTDEIVPNRNKFYFKLKESMLKEHEIGFVKSHLVGLGPEGDGWDQTK